MFLALLAFAAAFFALIKGSDLAERVRRLENDRDDLLARVAFQQKQLERLRTSAGARTVNEKAKARWWPDWEMAPRGALVWGAIILAIIALIALTLRTIKGG